MQLFGPTQYSSLDCGKKMGLLPYELIVDSVQSSYTSESYMFSMFSTKN